MKKVILSTIAIFAITSGTSFAVQDASHVMADHSSKAEVHHVTTAESNNDCFSNPTGMTHMHGHMKGMKGHGKMGDKSGMMGHGMMGGKSGMMNEQCMMHCMSGKMSHGKMAGKSGMRGHGMMGLGFHMPGHENWTAEQHEQFLNNTSEIRKKLVLKRYEISEARRNKNTTPDQFGTLDKELIDIRTELQKKALEINGAASKE